ncbi:MAG: MFS transporter [Caldilineaceae bacterium]
MPTTDLALPTEPTPTEPTPTEPTNVEKLRGLPWSIAGDTSVTIFSQLIFFGSVFILFLDRLGLNKTEIGSLLSLIPFAGTLALFIAPAAARFGYKRTFVTFFGIRKVITAFLLLTPWVATTFGVGLASLFVAAITAGFALCKATADTAAYPWVQEYIPDSVRGKYYATSNLFCTIASFLVVLIAGFVMEQSRGLTGFMILIGAGVVAGFVSVWSYAQVPGGAPRAVAAGVDLRKVLAVGRDPNFRRYILGVGLIIVGFTPLLSFLPLFMRQVVGLSESNVVRLPIGALAGGLLAGYLWGWASDRYGSKPVMMVGLAIRLLLPLLWFLLPHHSPWSLYLALGIAVLQGIGDVGWVIGSARLLFVNVVPSAQSTEYMALYYALAGIITGASQLLGGWALDAMSGLNLTWGNFRLDEYTVLMALAFLLTAGGFWIFSHVRGDSGVSTGQFAGLFLHGNPVRAFESMIRYYRAQDERDVVFMTERLGQTQSPLTVDELLDALRDPRFNVRYEAIISIARMRPDPRLTAALIEVMRGKSPALSVIAAWALGRSGDARALPPLREGLDSPYRSIQSHCARALATLGDKESIPLLLPRLQDEPDYGLQIAYASALGKLKARDATPMLLTLLQRADDESIQMELALAIARTLGDEHYFILLLRRTRTETGTALAQALVPLRRKVSKLTDGNQDALILFDAVSDRLAHNDLAESAQRLQALIQQLPLAQLPVVEAAVLRACATQLAQWGAQRLEYLLLVLQTLHSFEAAVRTARNR